VFALTLLLSGLQFLLTPFWLLVKNMFRFVVYVCCYVQTIVANCTCCCQMWPACVRQRTGLLSEMKPEDFSDQQYELAQAVSLNTLTADFLTLSCRMFVSTYCDVWQKANCRPSVQLSLIYCLFWEMLNVEWQQAAGEPTVCFAGCRLTVGTVVVVWLSKR
jgi:hypothetical protein